MPLVISGLGVLQGGKRAAAGGVSVKSEQRIAVLLWLTGSLLQFSGQTGPSLTLLPLAFSTQV